LVTGFGIGMPDAGIANRRPESKAAVEKFL